MGDFVQSRQYFLQSGYSGPLVNSDANVRISVISDTLYEKRLPAAGALVTPTLAITGGRGERFSFLAMGESFNNLQSIDHPVLRIFNEVVGWPDLPFDQLPTMVQNLPIADLSMFGFIFYRGSGKRVITGGKGLNSAGMRLVGMQNVLVRGQNYFMPYPFIHSTGDDFWIQTPIISKAIKAIGIVSKDLRESFTQRIEIPKKRWWERNKNIQLPRYNPNKALDKFDDYYSALSVWGIRANFREACGLITTHDEFFD